MFSERENRQSGMNHAKKELMSQMTPCRKRNDYAELGHDSVARLVPLKHLALRTSI